jgi:hypothetical protein
MTERLLIEKSIENNDIILFKELISKDTSITPHHYSYLFFLTCGYGNIDFVKFLIQHEKVDPSYDNNAAIRSAAQKGYLDITQFLLEDSRIDPSGFYNYAISDADKYGYTNIIKLLWNDSRVKSTLKEHNSKLYNRLLLQLKINKF